MRQIPIQGEPIPYAYSELFPLHFEPYASYKLDYSYEDTPLHTHTDFYEISLITKGSYINAYNGETKCYPKNSLLFWRPGETHALYINEPQSAHCSFILEQDTFMRIFECYHPDKPEIKNTVFAEVMLSSEKAAYLSSIASNAVAGKGNTQEFLQLFLHMALSYLFYEKPKLIENKKPDLNECINDLIIRYESPDFLATPISEVYDMYPICNVTLIAHFKKITGYTIVEYRNIKRMEYSARLLSEQKMSCTQVASLIGISSLSYFSKKFYEYYKIYPNEYSYKYHEFPSIRD